MCANCYDRTNERASIWLGAEDNSLLLFLHSCTTLKAVSEGSITSATTSQRLALLRDEDGRSTLLGRTAKPQEVLCFFHGAQIEDER